jgi:hypothetical protein
MVLVLSEEKVSIEKGGRGEKEIQTSWEETNPVRKKKRVSRWKRPSHPCQPYGYCVFMASRRWWYTGDMETYTITKDNYVDTMRLIRRQQHMTQHYVAVILGGGDRASGVPASQVSMWEAGLMRPRIDSFLRWTDAIGCDVMLVPRNRDENELGHFEEHDEPVAA